MKLVRSSLILPLLFLTSASANAASEPPELRSLVTRANVLLQSGQWSEAAKSYSEAIQLSPADYSLYYKRATAYYSSNRHAQAMDDVDTVLKMSTGSFHTALIMKARLYAQEGNWSKAREYAKQFSSKVGTGNKEAIDLLFNISEGDTASKSAASAYKSKKYDECIEHTTKALQTASHSIPTRRLRADCSLLSGDIEAAVGDLTRLSHLLPFDPALYLRISHLQYYILTPSTPSPALTTLKQCLHHDPDNKACRKSLRLFKSAAKDFEKYEKLEGQQSRDGKKDWRGMIRVLLGYKDTEGLVSKFEREFLAAVPSLDLPSDMDAKKHSGLRTRLYKAVCRAYVQDGQPKKGLEWCDQVLKVDETDQDALMARGEIALQDQEWEEAVRAFEKAFEASGRSSQQIHQKLEKARRLYKQSKKKDYYKVLGVSRDADDRTIKKAYRSAAKAAHPDKGGSEAKMAQVNEAYEVLNNPELRARFDNGDDPNDPESQHGPGGGHPFFQQGGPMFFQQGGPMFGGGGMPFGGGGGGPGGGNFHFQWS